MISPLIALASLSVSWACVCIKMDMKPPNTGQNTDAQKRTANAAASPAKYGRTIHIFTDANPRLFNIPPRDSKARDKEYDRRTSAKRSNKREKKDYKLEDGRHRSTKMWYCLLYGILMLGKCPLLRHFKNHY